MEGDYIAEVWKGNVLVFGRLYKTMGGARRAIKRMSAAGDAWVIRARASGFGRFGWEVVEWGETVRSHTKLKPPSGDASHAPGCILGHPTLAGRAAGLSHCFLPAASYFYPARDDRPARARCRVSLMATPAPLFSAAPALRHMVFRSAPCRCMTVNYKYLHLHVVHAGMNRQRRHGKCTQATQT